MHTLLNIRGDPNIGVLCFTNDDITLVPEFIHSRDAKEIKEVLKTKLVRVNICGTPLDGCLVAGNSNGLLVPYTCYEQEIETLENAGIKFRILKSRFTALGNLILANSNGAIVSPEFSDKELKTIKSVLDVKTVRGTIAGLNVVGSAAVATDKGVLAHPQIREEEIKILEQTLKVPVDVGTVNFGVPFIRSGLLVNNKGAVIGIMTSGPELIQITELLIK